MTDFVVNLADTHLKNLPKSLIEHGRPRGLMALILVAVRMYYASHALISWNVPRAFKTSEFVKPGAFNSEHNITDYSLNTSKASTNSITGTSSMRNVAFPKIARLQNTARALPQIHRSLK